jgi:hypothetical protein
MDILAIIIVTICIQRATSRDNLIGAILASAILYGLVKAPVMALLMYYNGWAFTMPIQVPQWAHTVSGSISVGFWAVILLCGPIQKMRYYLAKRKLKRIMVPAITSK